MCNSSNEDVPYWDGRVSEAGDNCRYCKELWVRAPCPPKVQLRTNPVQFWRWKASARAG